MHIILFLYFCVLTCIVKSDVPNSDSDRFVLKQVVILSRHGLRSPLSKYLTQMTPKEWPSWIVKPGYLTAKGATLEGYMGSFFGAWLVNQGLMDKKCPNEDIFYVYANTKQRTRASAKAFVKKAFPNCNITIHHSDRNIDPLFNPVIHNTSLIFRQDVLEDMRKTLNMLSLNNSYEYLEKVLDYNDSELCKKEKKCDLLTDKNKPLVLVGQKPNVSGPIKIGNSVVDAFVMQYYEGLSIDNVAWGWLRSSTDWQTLTDLSKGYHNVIFNITPIAQDVSKPLIKYIKSIFLNEKPKVTLLMGHDANIYTVIKTLNFKSYSLPNQYELCPVGGKLIFQKWYDYFEKKYLLKIQFVYQSTDQLRNASVLSLDNMPQFKLMELEECNVDNKGFCLWDDFKKILERE